MAIRLDVALIVASLFVLAGCLPPGPAPSETRSVAGTWAGTTNDSLAGAGTFRVTITQAVTVLSGTWVSTFASQSNNNGGSLSGGVNGSTVSVALVPSVQTRLCQLAVSATVNGNQMTGTYASVSCSVAVTGSINLTKE